MDEERKKKRRTITIYFTLAGLIAATWSSRIPAVQERLQLDDAAWGRVLVSMPAGLVAGLSLAGWMAARFGTKNIVLITGTLSCATLFLAGQMASPFQLGVALFLLGFLRTIFNISINTEAAETQKLYPKPIMSTFHGMWSMACFAAAGIAYLMISHDRPPAEHFTLIAILCLVLTVYFGWNRGKEKHEPPSKRPFLVMPDRYLFLLGLIAFCAMICESTMFDWSVNYFKNVIGAKKGMITAGYTAFMVTMAIGRLFGDRVTARFGPASLLTLCGLMMTGGFLLAGFFPLMIPALLGFLLIGLGDSVVVPLVISLSARSTKMASGYAIASVTLIGYTGFLSGPLLVGSLSKSIGLQWALGVISLFSFCIMLLSFRIRKHLYPEPAIVPVNT
jgi:MFS family permease